MRLLFYRLENSEWVSGHKPRLTKEGKTIVCKTDTFVGLVVPGLFTSSGSNSSSTSGIVNKISPWVKWRTSPTKVVRIILKNPTTKIKRGMAVEMRTTVCEIFLNGWSSQIIQRTQKCLHLHTFLRTQIRNVLRKWHQNPGSTAFILSSEKTEMAMSAFKPKWQGLLAEDALAKLYLGQKSLVTWWRLMAREMGPQGRSATGGLARVPNLRVCKHPCHRGGTRKGETGELTSCRGTV